MTMNTCTNIFPQNTQGYTQTHKNTTNTYIKMSIENHPLWAVARKATCYIRVANLPKVGGVFLLQNFSILEYFPSLWSIFARTSFSKKYFGVFCKLLEYFSANKNKIHKKHTTEAFNFKYKGSEKGIPYFFSHVTIRRNRAFWLDWGNLLDRAKLIDCNQTYILI